MESKLRRFATAAVAAALLACSSARAQSLEQLMQQSELFSPVPNRCEAVQLSPLEITPAPIALPEKIAEHIPQVILPPLTKAPHIHTEYASAWNARRPARAQTKYIILHTGEGEGRGLLKWIRDRGLANYVVQNDGDIYRIMEPQRLAKHVHYTMWNGEQNLREKSVGIELEGFHDLPPTPQQVQSLRWLIDALQQRYHIPDDRVLPHAMVAYDPVGSHDGKRYRRCGMLLARADMRAQLGLDPAPVSDPDVSAGRLSVRDDLLNTVLYGKEDLLPEALSVISAEASAYREARNISVQR